MIPTGLVFDLAITVKPTLTLNNREMLSRFFFKHSNLLLVYFLVL